MKVLLAGFNVDTEVLKDITRGCEARADVTPEVLSAAYARISRDPRPIDEIRTSARGEVEKARKSNEAIIFKMGHHSIAEHAIFNFDIIGPSRLAMEALEKFRLCSYTEKSQRYITLENDFVIPPELAQSEYRDDFVAMIKEQNALYHSLFAKLKEHVFDTNKGLAENPKKHSLLEGWAKEDARYITSLATEAQVGLTINARNLELVLRRFASHPLEEIRQLGRHMYDQVKKIAPSILLFNEANDLDEKTYSELRDCAKNMLPQGATSTSQVHGGSVELIDYDKDGDQTIIAALLHSSSQESFATCKARVEKMNHDQKMKVLKTACAHVQLYDSLLREYEYASLTYEVVISAACFGQLKRHRMATITTQDYDPNLGVTLPQSIKDIGMEEECLKVIQRTNDVYYRIYPFFPHVAPYILTNAHQRRVLVRSNVRELYHMSRLREDAHAQWDIREKTALMSQQAKKVMPFSCMLIGGKDSYGSIYEEVFGQAPRITVASPPNVGKST